MFENLASRLEAIAINMFENLGRTRCLCRRKGHVPLKNMVGVQVR